MFRKIITTFFLFSFCFLYATTKDNIDSLLNKTNSIALAHISLVEDRSIASTSSASLISYGYLDINFTNDNLFGGSISYASNSTSVDINTDILSSSLTTEEKDYFLNHYTNAIYGRTIYEKSSRIYVQYFYSNKAISNLINDNSQNTYIGDAVPNSYVTPSVNNTWWDSNDVSFNVKKYVDSSWVNEDYTNQNLNADGSYSNINSIALAKTSWNFSEVTSTEKTKTIVCRAGSTYNQANNRCEAFTSDACDGNYFDTATNKCYKKPSEYCTAIGYAGYDNVNNRCYKTSYVGKVANTITVTTKNYYWYIDKIRYVELNSSHTVSADVKYNTTPKLTKNLTGLYSGSHAWVSGNTGSVNTLCSPTNPIWYRCTYSYSMPSISYNYYGSKPTSSEVYIFIDGGVEGGS
jgi:hypothetical protein